MNRSPLYLGKMEMRIYIIDESVAFANISLQGLSFSQFSFVGVHSFLSQQLKKTKGSILQIFSFDFVLPSLLN